MNDIAESLSQHGYCVLPSALPRELVHSLVEYIQSPASKSLQLAAIGRNKSKSLNSEIRRDTILWLDESSSAGSIWLQWMESLKQELNRKLFLGLFSYESHLAKYSAGDFYKLHRDAFPGQANRILSTVVYLNEDWNNEDGGELRLYDQDEKIIQAVLPTLGTLVIFLSEEFPHEVLPAKKERWSIAGWFRMNNSTGRNIDPPT